MFDVFKDFFDTVDFSDMNFSKFIDFLSDFFAVIIEFFKGVAGGNAE